jgi:transcriptional regulator with XRE-family HTH domain
MRKTEGAASEVRAASSLTHAALLAAADASVRENVLDALLSALRMLMRDDGAINAVDRRLGERLRRRRLELRLSPDRLADGLGISVEELQQHEKGLTSFAAHRLGDFCAVLDLPLRAALESIALHEKSAPMQNPDVGLANVESVKLAQLFSAIESATVRRRVIEVVRAMTLGDEPA